MELEELVKRVTRLEAIKRLKARYCEICDHEEYDADAMASLFTEDGTWEAGFANAEGREAIRELFSSSARWINSAR